MVVADDNSTKDAREMTQMMGSLMDSQGLMTGKTGDLTKTASKASLLLPRGGTTLQTYIYFLCIISKTENLRKSWQWLGAKMGTNITLLLFPYTLVRFYTLFYQDKPLLGMLPSWKKGSASWTVLEVVSRSTTNLWKPWIQIGCQKVFSRSPASSKPSYQATVLHQSCFSGLTPVTWWPWKFAFPALHS